MDNGDKLKYGPATNDDGDGARRFANFVLLARGDFYRDGRPPNGHFGRFVKSSSGRKDELLYEKNWKIHESQMKTPVKMHKNREYITLFLNFIIYVQYLLFLHCFNFNVYNIYTLCSKIFLNKLLEYITYIRSYNTNLKFVS